MEGSGIEGLKLKDRNVPVESEQQRTLDRDTPGFIAAMKMLMDFQDSRTRVTVDGFNPSADPVELHASLEHLFKNCGEVDFIHIRIDPSTKKIIRPCVVYLLGEEAKKKASLLDGSEVGGRTLSVSALENPTDGLSSNARAASFVSDFQKKRSQAISVTGYDSSLPQEALKIALRKHFAPCGEVTDVSVLDSHALVHLYGLGAVLRAVRLNGTDLGGGFNLTVSAVQYPRSQYAAGSSCDVVTNII